MEVELSPLPGYRDLGGYREPPKEKFSHPEEGDVKDLQPRAALESQGCHVSTRDPSLPPSFSGCAILISHFLLFSKSIQAHSVERLCVCRGEREDEGRETVVWRKSEIVKESCMYVVSPGEARGLQ